MEITVQAFSWWKAAWEVRWTSWSHAPLPHIDPHHVTKECFVSFVLASTALTELKAILHTIERWPARHSSSPFSSRFLPKQDLWGGPLLQRLNHSKRQWSPLPHPPHPPSGAGAQPNGIIWVRSRRESRAFYFYTSRFVNAERQKAQPAERISAGVLNRGAPLRAVYEQPASKTHTNHIPVLSVGPVIRTWWPGGCFSFCFLLLFFLIFGLIDYCQDYTHTHIPNLLFFFS